MKQLDVILLKASLPKSTPAGLEIGDDAKTQYLAQASIAAIPTLAVETAISDNEWGDDAVGRADRNISSPHFHALMKLFQQTLFSMLFIQKPRKAAT
jgi:hypothetical protein